MKTSALPRQNRTGIVTGGGTGIGRAISTLMAGQGAAVAIIYSRSDKDAQDTVTAITDEGGRAVALQADIIDASAVRSAMETAAHSFGGIDYLVNNAGITTNVKFDELGRIALGTWDERYNVHVK